MVNGEGRPILLEGSPVGRPSKVASTCPAGGACLLLPTGIEVLDCGILNGEVAVLLHLEVEQETDGRWLAEITDLPGVMAYGVTRPDAIARVQALALRSLADRMEHGEAVPELLQVSFQPA